MKFYKAAAFAGLVAAALVSGRAQADTIVWKDPVHGFTISYPDSWRVQAEDVAGTRLRVAGPYAQDLAMCRMKVFEDGRLKIYPKRLADEAVSQTLDRDFWAGEVAQFDNARVDHFFDPASMGGDGDATAIHASFDFDGEDDVKIPMHGYMIGSVYNGKRYVASCMARADVFSRWSPVFASVLGSVALEGKYHPFATGYYRGFLADPKFNLPRTQPGTTYEKSHIPWYKRWFTPTSKYHR